MHNDDVAGLMAVPVVMTIVLVCMLVLLLPTIFFLLTMQRTLQRCDESSRTMSPGLVWLSIIPAFGVVWNFFIVNAIADSLHNEFVRRGITAEPRPARSIGMAWAILWALSVVPLVNFVSSIPALICWILYWVKVAEYSGKLAHSTAPAPAMG